MRRKALQAPSPSRAMFPPRESSVFEVTDRTWRGINAVPQSGWKLRPDYEQFDAENRFDVSGIHTQNRPSVAAAVLQGLLGNQCPAFGKQCAADPAFGAL